MFLATGGAVERPSANNSNIKWIFSTSLTQAEIAATASSPDFAPLATLRLITVGRLEREKNVHSTIESLIHIREMFPDCQLDVVGGGSQLASLQELVVALGLSNCVFFHGRVNHQAVLDLLKPAHIFCFPTRSSEGFPKVVLEALASGVPVITTPVSVLPMLIGENQCGLILSEPSPRSIADAVQKIAEDQELFRNMSMRAVETAEKYSLENWRDTIGILLEAQWGDPLRDHA